ncbi:MAG: septum formation initiator family protein [Alphaproteobacteria bacterium]|nr:septum formation initiator family protein [Alphaproteobacteria bacterium]
MGILYEVRRRARAAVAPFICFVLVIYFGYHAIHGNRGLLVRMQLKHEIERAALAHASLVEERRRLEHRIAFLRPESLDRDLLTERAHQVLGLVGDDEVVILNR